MFGNVTHCGSVGRNTRSRRRKIATPQPKISTLPLGNSEKERELRAGHKQKQIFPQRSRRCRESNQLCVHTVKQKLFPYTENNLTNSLCIQFCLTKLDVVTFLEDRCLDFINLFLCLGATLQAF